MTWPLADLTHVFARGKEQVIVSVHHSRCIGCTPVSMVDWFRAVRRRFLGSRKLLFQAFDLLLELIL